LSGERHPLLVLASRSPQRRRILELLGVPFVVERTEVGEEQRGEPRAVAIANACRKARAVHADLPVLGADTVVALDGAVLGEPNDAGEARSFLARLAGRTHTVTSAICLRTPDGEERIAERSARVAFRKLGARDIDWYVASGEWRGRAGGYAIQLRGMALVERVEGDPTAVVGLPVAGLIELWPGLVHCEPLAPLQGHGHG
jgi:septum formation protein